MEPEFACWAGWFQSPRTFCQAKLKLCGVRVLWGSILGADSRAPPLGILIPLAWQGARGLHDSDAFQQRTAL